MNKPAWTPWHEVVKIRPDLKPGELSLNIFAADLYDVAMDRAKPVYQDARELFALTCPTYNLRELAKDERSVLESISTHISARPASAEDRQGYIFAKRDA